VHPATLVTLPTHYTLVTAICSGPPTQPAVAWERGARCSSRLVFLLGEDTEGPAAMFGDLEHGARQHAFRSRLASSGVTTATVTSPGVLETALLQALTALPRPEPWPAPSNAAIGKIGRRVGTIPARVRGFTGRAELLAELDAVLRSEDRPSVVQAVTGMAGSARPRPRS
jgi:hypothetical protein